MGALSFQKIETTAARRFKFRNRESCISKLIDKNSRSECVISTVDLSPSGIAFLNHSSKLLKVGDTAMIELAPFGEPPIRSFVKIVRAEPVAGTMLYGAKFIALPLLHRDRLDKMIKDAYQTQAGHSLSKGRRGLTGRMNPLKLAQVMTWVALLLTVLFTISRYTDLFLTTT